MNTTYTDKLISKLIEDCTWKDPSGIPNDKDWINELYLEALAFVTGSHPEGTIGHWEDTNFQWSPNGITSLDGPCIVNPSPPVSVSDDDFIWYYVSSNYWGEGTPIYIDNSIH